MEANYAARPRVLLFATGIGCSEKRRSICKKALNGNRSTTVFLVCKVAMATEFLNAVRVRPWFF